MKEVPSGVLMSIALLAGMLAFYIAGMDTDTVLKIGGFGLLIIWLYGRF